MKSQTFAEHQFNIRTASIRDQILAQIPLQGTRLEFVESERDEEFVVNSPIRGGNPDEGDYLVEDGQLGIFAYLTSSEGQDTEVIVGEMKKNIEDTSRPIPEGITLLGEPCSVGLNYEHIYEMEDKTPDGKTVFAWGILMDNERLLPLIIYNFKDRLLEGKPIVVINRLHKAEINQ